MKCTMFTSCNIALLALVAVHYSTICLGHPFDETSVEKRSAPLVMGSAKTFGAVAATTLTSTGNTLIRGDCGTCPGTAITGFPPGVCTGITSAGGTAACNAEAACLAVYNNGKGLIPTKALTSMDLGGLTLAPGVYTFPTSSATLSTTLKLNGATNSKGQFVFQISTTFATSVNSKIILEHGAQACNVYFIVCSSATIGAGTTFLGNLIAYDSISVGSGATINGTLCALNGAITLIDDTINAQPICTTS